MPHKIAGQLTYQGQPIGEIFFADAEYELKAMAHDKVIAMEKEMGDEFKDFFPVQTPGWKLNIIDQ